MITTIDLIKLGANSNNSDKYINFINEYCNTYNVNTEARICNFLAQIFHESGNLSVVKENLYYTTTSRLQAIWPSRFPTSESALPFVRNESLLAEKTYSGRLGNTEPGEGYKFRGRGLIQITGKYNYRAFGVFCNQDFISNPDLLLEPRFAVLSAFWFWNKSNCNAFADSDSSEAMKQTTKIINGGYGNLKERIATWSKAKNIFANRTITEIAPTKIEIPVFKLPEIIETKQEEVKPNIFLFILNIILKLLKRK